MLCWVRPGLLKISDNYSRVAVALQSLNGEFFTSLLSADFIISVGSVMSSPHVQVDPAVRVVYYNLVFHGYLVDGNQEPKIAQVLYLNCLQAIARWQENATGSVMDLIASSISTWTAYHSFDHNLAAKMHAQACIFAKGLGLHQLDVDSDSVSGMQIEKVKEKQRTSLWQLVLTDLFIRLHYNQPSHISAEVSPQSVRLASPQDLTTQRPRLDVYALEVVWARVIFIAKQFFEHYDQGEDEVMSKDFQRLVDDWCDEIELILEEWHLVRHLA